MARDTSDTDLHALARPAVGSDWVAEWDDLVETVDANLKLSGYIGDRPSASEAPSGAWYEAIDQGLIYRNDPTNGWVVVGGTGTASNPIPNQYVDTQEVSTVKDASSGNSYDVDALASGGSKPDYSMVAYVDGGTMFVDDDDGNRVDDGSNHASVLATALSNLGGHLHFKPGTYVYDDLSNMPLTIPSDTGFAGEGYNNTEFQHAADTHLFDLSNPRIETEGYYVNPTVSLSNSTASLHNPSPGSRHQDIWMVSGNGGRGVSHDGTNSCTRSTFARITIRGYYDCWFANPDTDGYFNNNNMTDIELSNASRFGLFLNHASGQRCQGNRIDNAVIQANADGWHAKGLGTIATGVHLENNTNSDIVWGSSNPGGQYIVSDSTNTESGTRPTTLEYWEQGSKIT